MAGFFYVYIFCEPEFPKGIPRDEGCSQECSKTMGTPLAEGIPWENLSARAGGRLIDFIL